MSPGSDTATRYEWISRMKASILTRYLLGSRQAILEVAASRWSIWVGLIFVLSAGLAREYDGEDLVHEPWHALRPLGASLASGTALFLLIHIAAILNKRRGEGSPPPFFTAWMSFLGLFWLTAPMAWLYAIPHERYMNPVDAIFVNLWTLAIVALWRVILMVRIIHVVYGIGYASSFFLVMLFADAVVFAVMALVPTPVIDIMGGIRHSDRDALIASVTFSVTLLSVFTAPLWLVGAMISSAVLKPKWPDLSGFADRKGSYGLLLISAASVVAFVPLLIVGQPEQMNRRDVETLFEQGRVAEALSTMSQRSQSDYPPHWNPPPRIGYRETVPSLESVRDAMSDQWPSDWVASIYIAKIERALLNDALPFGASMSWAQIVGYLQEYETGPELEPRHRESAQFLLDHRLSLDSSEREALEQLVEMLSPEGADKDTTN